MLLIGILATVANAADFSVGDMPCARRETPVFVTDATKNVQWPFKTVAARLAMEAKAQADAHAEECTRLLTVASSTAAQDEHAGLALEVAVVNGQSVSFDGRKAVLITADAAVAHEMPNGAFGGYGVNGGYRSSDDLVIAQTLGFFAGQNGVGTVSGGSTKSAPKPKKSEAEIVADAELAKAKAAAKAEAERKARAEAARAAAAAGS